MTTKDNMMNYDLNGEKILESLSFEAISFILFVDKKHGNMTYTGILLWNLKNLISTLIIL